VVSIKSMPGHDTPNLCFCIWWDLLVTYFIPVRPGRKKAMYYFPSLGGTGTDLIKSASGHVMPDLCVVHQMGSASHVVHSGASRARNIDT
jgi:hypothetical protein